MALVLAVLGGPERPGGGAFRSCPTCGELYARAGEDRRWLDRRAYRMLAREILRLRALVPPELRHAPSVRRPLAEVGDSDPALPRNIGQAAERNRRLRTAPPASCSDEASGWAPPGLPGRPAG